MIKVIGIGDNVCDQYYPAKIMYPGGQAMNFSVYAKMLGAQSAYLGVFGNDRVAEHIISVLDDRGRSFQMQAICRREWIRKSPA